MVYICYQFAVKLKRKGHSYNKISITPYNEVVSNEDTHAGMCCTDDVFIDNKQADPCISRHKIT